MSRISAGSAESDLLGDVSSASDGDEAAGTRPAIRVRAVVVTTGGPRLAETLASLASQTYPELGVTVVDASGDRSRRDGRAEADRTAEIAANSHAALVETRRASGFAAAANMILADSGLDAEWLLLCHDEVALEPNALEQLVDGATAAGVQIAAPKIRDWSNPDVLREVGMGSDRFGYPYTSVEVDEVDHGQHDGDRTSLYVTTSCMLILTDLFRSLGGFDAGMGSVEHDLDLCWRARVVGAEIAVIPSSVAYHDPGPIDHGQIAYPRIAAQRNRLRTIVKCYSFTSLPVVLFQLLMLNALEVVLLAASGRGRRARSVIGAWASTAAHCLPILRDRRRVQRSRRIKDAEIRNLQLSSSARVRAYIENRLRTGDSDEDVPVSLQSSGTGAWEFAIHEVTRPQVIFWLVVLVLFLVGGRRFIVDSNVPLVGEAVPIPSSSELWRDFAASWHSFGFGTPSPTSPAGFLLGLIQWIFPSRGTAKLVLFSYLAGLVGVWRLSSKLGKWPGPGIALILYGLSPVAIGAMQRGNISAITFFGLAPFIVSRLVGCYQKEGGAIRRVLSLSLLIAVAAAFFPPALPISIGIAAVMVIASIFASRLVASMGAFLTALFASAIAFGLLWPWSLALVRPGSPLENAWRNWPGARVQVGVAGALRMQVAEAGAAPWGYLIVALAFAALLVVRGERLGWAARLWPVGLASMATLWLAGQGVVPPALPIAIGMLVPAALLLSVTAGLGGSEMAEDPGRFKAGTWRVTAVVVGVAAVVFLAVPLYTFINGRFGMRENGYRRAIAQSAATGERGSFKVLWLGRQEDLPGYPLSLPEGGGAYSLTGPDGPVFGDTSPQTPGTGSAHMSQVLRGIASEGSSRGGRSLATLGVRYVVIPAQTEAGPVGSTMPSSSIIAGLKRQLDIAEVPSAGTGITVLAVAPDAALWDATKVGPSVAESARRQESGGGSVQNDRLLSADFNAVNPVFAVPNPGATGILVGERGDAVILAEEYDERWGLKSTAGSASVGATHEESFNWSNMFVLGAPTSSTVTLTFDAGDARRNQLLIEGAAVLVLLLLVFLFRRRGYDEDAARPERPAAVT